MTQDQPETVSAEPSDPVSDTQKAYVTLLFNKYRGPLLRYLQRIVPAEDAGDLVQETYFRLLRHGNIQQFESMARSFLFQTATNLARDHHRRLSTRQAGQHVSLDAEAGFDAPVEPVGPVDQIAGEQTLVRLEQALLRMPGDQRRVFLLCRFHGLQYAEIATQLGMSTRTVARKMADAVDRLASVLKESA